MVTSRMEINKDLLPVKAHFFFFNAGTAPLVPYLTTYAKQLGFSTSVVGFIYTLLPIFGMIAKPLFGFIADRFHKHKIIFIVFQVVTICGFLGLYFIPNSVENVTELSCGDGESFFHVCYKENNIIEECTMMDLTKDKHVAKCQMNCRIDKPYMWQTVCEHWKMPQYCYHNKTELHMTTLIPKERILRPINKNNCITYFVNQTRMSDGQYYTPVCKDVEYLDLTCKIFCSDYRFNNLTTKGDVNMHCAENAVYFSSCHHTQNEIDTFFDQIKNETGDVECYTVCNVRFPWQWATICDNWKTEKIDECLPNNLLPNSLSFMGIIPMDKTFKLEQCLHFKIQKILTDEGSTHFPSCPRVLKETPHFKSSCETICNNSIINDAIISNHKSDDVMYNRQFITFFIFMVLNWIGMAVVVSLGDAICFEKLGDNPNGYGRQRLWGSAGWGIFSLCTGFLIDYFSEQKEYKNYSVAFILMLIFMLCDIAVSTFLSYNQRKVAVNIFGNFGVMFSSWQTIHFFIWMVLVGMCTGLIWQFLFWFLEDLAHSEGCSYSDWIKTIQGIASALQCFGGEVPFFFISGWIIQRIGHIHSMSLILLGFGVRLTLYSLLTNPWWTLPIELFQGITFGILFATMNSYASIISPPGIEATVMGLSGAVFEGIGTSLGNLISGILYQNIGGRMTFRIFGIGAFICCLVNVLLSCTKVLKAQRLEVSDYSSVLYGENSDAVNIVDSSKNDLDVLE